MRKKTARTGLFACVLAVMVMFTFVIAPQSVYADGPNGEIKFAKNMTVSRVVYCADINMGTKTKGAKKVTVTSSNKKVFKPMEAFKDGKKFYLLGEPVKKGTATLKVKVTKKSGTKTYKGKLKVVAYKNPMKKMKLGSKDITKKFRSNNFYELNTSASQGKISVKPKAGWKVKEITYGYYSVSKDDWVQKTVKNNSTIKYYGDGGTVVVTLYKKSANQTEWMIVNVNKN